MTNDDLRERQLHGSVPDRTVLQLQDGPPLEILEPGLVYTLHQFSNLWGPELVAHAAAQVAGGRFAKRVPEAQVNRPIVGGRPDEDRLLDPRLPADGRDWCLTCRTGTEGLFVEDEQGVLWHRNHGEEGGHLAHAEPLRDLTNPTYGHALAEWQKPWGPYSGIAAHEWHRAPDASSSEWRDATSSDEPAAAPTEVAAKPTSATAIAVVALCVAILSVAFSATALFLWYEIAYEVVGR